MTADVDRLAALERGLASLRRPPIAEQPRPRGWAAEAAHAHEQARLARERAAREAAARERERWERERPAREAREREIARFDVRLNEIAKEIGALRAKADAVTRERETLRAKPL